MISDHDYLINVFILFKPIVNNRGYRYISLFIEPCTQHILFTLNIEGKKEGNVLFNNALNTFYYDIWKEGRKEKFYLTTHSTHFIYGYMVSDIW